MTTHEEHRATEKLLFASVWNMLTFVSAFAPDTIGAQLSAIETVASILRRKLRDCEVSKDDVEALRKGASEHAEYIYEESGLGRSMRAHVRQSKRAEGLASDDSYEKAERERAARLANEAIQQAFAANKDKGGAQ